MHVGEWRLGEFAVFALCTLCAIWGEKCDLLLSPRARFYMSSFAIVHAMDTITPSPDGVGEGTEVPTGEVQFLHIDATSANGLSSSTKSLAMGSSEEAHARGDGPEGATTPPRTPSSSSTARSPGSVAFFTSAALSSSSSTEKRTEKQGETEWPQTDEKPAPLDTMSYAKHAALSLSSLSFDTDVSEVTHACAAFVSAMQQLLPEAKNNVSGDEVILFLSRAMRAYIESAEFLVQAFKSLSELAYSVDCMNHQFFDEDLFATVLSGMKHHNTRPSVQEWGCVAIRCFARHANNTVAIAKVGGIEQVMECMTQHLDRTDIQVESFKALFNLAFNTNNQVAIVRMGGLHLILKAFNAHEDNRAVNEFGCNLLHNLAFKNLANKQEIAAQGCVEVIIKAMRAHYGAPKVQIEACRALMSLAFASECQNKIADSGGIRVVFEAMLASKRCKEVQIEACKVLCTLALNHMDNKTIIADNMIVIIEAMTFHAKCGELQGEGCAALATLSFRSPKNKRKIAALGGVDVILAAMKEHLESQDVQVDGCKALASLAFDTELQLKIAQEGGITVILNSMSFHVGKHPQVQAEASKALSELAYRCSDNKKAICDNGGAETIVKAMEEHLDDWRVQLEGCRALFSQAIHTENKSRIIGCGSIPAVLNGMTAHAFMDSVQDHGCRLLTEMMFNNVAVVESTRKLRGVSVIVKAILNHAIPASSVVSTVKVPGGVDSSTTNLTTSLDDEAKVDSPTMSSLSSKSSGSVEDRACKALVHFAPQEIFEATCELFINATEELELIRVMRLFVLTRQVADIQRRKKNTMEGKSNDTPVEDQAVASEVLARKAELASWRAAVLEMGKVKRKEDEALWSRQVAKGFGQLLKFFKKLK